MDTFPDLGSLSDQELKDLIQQLTEEEVDISYRRRILHGKIDILRAELVNRLRKKDETGELVISGADVQQLTDILAGRVPANEPAMVQATMSASHSAITVLGRREARRAAARTKRARPPEGGGEEVMSMVVEPPGGGPVCRWGTRASLSGACPTSRGGENPTTSL